MVRERTKFVCQECGTESPRWMGKCSGCGLWNTMAEEKITAGKTGKENMRNANAKPCVLSSVEKEQGRRVASGFAELDRVLGGGWVNGSLVLMGGDPGIGKSTLLLQAAEKLAEKGSILYITGEESVSQIAIRAERLGLNGDKISVLPENRMELIMNHISETDPAYVIVDSIQTMYTEELSSAPGSVGQVRECGLGFLNEAKTSCRTTVLVGHVTKTGSIAGPKVLEHMVDTVLYLEGDLNGDFRVLRSVKNRFGSTNEIGIFEMQEKGLKGVQDASRLFINERAPEESGTVIFPAVEGSRIFLLEVQALVSTSPFGNPRRLATGYDLNRLLLMAAVVEKKIGAMLGNMDIYLNVAGGMKITEPAADLAVCLAIISSLRGKPLDPETMAIGEVGLVGEIRSVPQIEKRIREGYELGFRRILLPRKSSSRLEVDVPVNICGANNLREAMKDAFGKS